MAGPNLHHLEVFHTVARLGSFSKASEAMSISQPTVSLQVRDLERYYGAPLFHRQGRGIKLTDVGEVVFSHTQQLFQTLEEMRRSVDNLKESVTGRLVLGASSTPGEYLAPHLLGRFTSFHPGVEVSLIIGNTASITAQVSSGEMDLGLVGDLADDPAVVSTRFYTDELVVFARPDYPLVGDGPVPPKALGQQSFVMREQGSATRRVAEERLKELEVPIKVSMEAGSNEAVKQAVAAGLGLGILSQLALKVEEAARVLKILDIPKLACRRHFYVLHHRNRYLSRPQQTFLDLVKDLSQD